MSTPPPIPAIPPEVAQPLWEVVLVWLGAITSVCAVLLIAWKVVRPHVQGYIESVVKPLQKTANETKHQLVTNGHTSAVPTVLDRIDRLSSEVGDLSRLSHRNTRKIDMLGQSLDEHKSESEVFLRRAVEQFAQQGIKLQVHDPPGYGDD